MYLPAQVGHVGLVKEEPRSVPPAIAVLGPIMREREDVVGGLANGAQDSAALGREGLKVSFLERYTGGNNDASRAADIKTIFQR